MKWAVLLFCLVVSADCFAFDWHPWCGRREVNQVVVVQQPVLIPVQVIPVVNTVMVQPVRVVYSVEYQTVTWNPIYYQTVPYYQAMPVVPVYKY